MISRQAALQLGQLVPRRTIGDRRAFGTERDLVLVVQHAHNGRVCAAGGRILTLFGIHIPLHVRSHRRHRFATPLVVVVGVHVGGGGRGLLRGTGQSKQCGERHHGLGMGEPEGRHRGPSVHPLIDGIEEIIQQRLRDGVGLALTGVARPLLVKIFGIQRPGEQFGVLCIFTLEILVEIEGVVTGVLVLHVGGDDIQVVQVHCGVVLALDLLGAFAARIGVLGRVGARRAVLGTLLGAIGGVVPRVFAVLEFGEEFVGEDLRQQVMRGPLDVGIVADGLLGTGDDLIVGHEILIIIRDVVCLGARCLFRTVGILHLMEVQGVGILLEILAVAGIGGIRRLDDAVGQLAAGSRIETLLEVFAGFGGTRLAGGLVGNRTAIDCSLVEQRLIALVRALADAVMLIRTLSGQHAVAVFDVGRGDAVQVFHELGFDGVRLESTIPLGRFGHLHQQRIILVAGQAA